MNDHLKHHKWGTTATIQIRAPWIEEKVTAKIYWPFASHPHHHHDGRWMLTHLPTGCSILQGRYFTSEAPATRLARILANIVATQDINPNITDPIHAAQVLSRAVLPRVEEFIAQESMGRFPISKRTVDVNDTRYLVTIDNATGDELHREPCPDPLQYEV